MAQKLDLKVVAEGLEQADQGEFLLQQGCELAQGFLYYEPMPMFELRKLNPRQVIQTKQA